MKITDIIKNNEVTVSFELFPPREGTLLEEAKQIVSDTAKLKPSFISVTYGAGGGTSEHTVNIADEIQNVYGIPALAHLTCVSSDSSMVKKVLGQLKEKNIENILALRGDIPKDKDFVLTEDYKHASQLIEEIKRFGDFCIGGACYPEGHPESESLQKDLEGIKIKVDAGCEFLATQMFFDNNILYNYMFRLLKSGVDVPVLAGIMPVTNKAQIKRIISLSGTELPQRFIRLVDRFGNNPAAMRQAGIAYATDQIIDLIANGVNNIHIYTMNKPDIAGSIMKNLSEIW